jgi:hypothetical protein
MDFSSIICPPLSHIGGNLCPLLRDVHLCAAIGHPVQAVPHATMGWEGDEPNRHLLLSALGQASGCVHRGHHPHQVGLPEGGLNNRAR